MISLLNAEKIKEQLKKGIDVFTFETVDSTNLLAKKSATKTDKDTLFIANHQTSGRGRMGRTFLSPENSGIYMSLLLHPQINFEDYSLITTAAAVSVAKTLDKFSAVKTQIKWVNDIFLNGKKVCGILTEGAFKSSSDAFAVLGIGINLYEPEKGFEEEIKEIAGCVFEEKCDEQIKIKIIAEVINNFYGFYENLPHKRFLPEYREKDMLLGKKINYVKNGKTYEAVATGITDNLELKVVDALKNETLLSTGEVTIGSGKRPNE